MRRHCAVEAWLFTSRYSTVTLVFTLPTPAGAISDWPVLQRLALLMEATVLTMKMHSYIVVNR